MVAFGVRGMPPLPLEVTQSITMVGIFHLEHGASVRTYLPQDRFECVVQLGSPLLERILTGILAWFSVFF